MFTGQLCLTTGLAAASSVLADCVVATCVGHTGKTDMSVVLPNDASHDATQSQQLKALTMEQLLPSITIE